MKKTVLLSALAAVAISASANENCAPCAINFEELPYSEGTLYISVAEGENNILLKAIEVESDSVSIPMCLCKYVGATLSVNAFQDLNGNQQLDFDNYGRPTEPCLRDQFSPTDDKYNFSFRLVEY